MTTEPQTLSAAHDHQACIDDALARAEQVCRARQSRLTKIRRDVLALVWESRAPVKAYGLLQAMQQRIGRPVNPPTVYRALDFLLEMKLIHRIEALNAYVGCSDPVDQCCGFLMICENCNSVSDIRVEELDTLLNRTAADLGFSVRSQITEVFGLCRRCVAADG